MRFLCRLKGVTLRDRHRSEDIINIFQVNKMTDGIKKYQKWRTHVHWMLIDCRLPKRAFSYRPERKRDLRKP
jgi:hypothetical protein